LVHRGTYLFQDIIKNISFSIIHFHNFHNVHITTLLTLQNFVYFVFFFFHSNRSVQKSDLFLFKIWNTKLQTHFLGRYGTKPNTASENKAAFVHLNWIEDAIRVNESFAFLTFTVNNYLFHSLLIQKGHLSLYYKILFRQ
jgi:hypothetical protein